MAPAQAEPTDTPGYAAGTYVVKLADQPVAAYQGGLKDLKRTAPAQGDRLKTDTTAVRAYLRHLDSRRDEVLDAVSGIKNLTGTTTRSTALSRSSPPARLLNRPPRQACSH
ncbi:hypothetical protein [Streptomyces canus]|uniref:hypothetical protein n=1 Tax=Streptomyces canus TaxID=58343 RepID=UPI0007483AD9|nr:hypothetical protein [Streptomyces canus]KUN00350.1 hypothetical protein AQI96_42655 [Streptomyces canus]